MSKTLLEVIAETPLRERSPVCRGFAKPPELESEELAVDPVGGDRKSGLIRGASLIAQGEALGHYAWIDRETLIQVAEFGNQSNKGVKVRFTHPSLSGDGLGSFLGRAKNLRVDGEKVLGDVHFSPASRQTPDGDLGEYVMGLADDDPESFGMSIVFEHDRQAEKEFIRENEVIDEEGYPEFVSPDPKNEKNYRHVRLRALFAVDFVDEPAANPEGLFHQGPSLPILESAERLTEYALGITETKPEETGGVSADRVRDFLSRFLAGRGLKLYIEKDRLMTKTPEKEAQPQTQEPQHSNPEQKPGEIQELEIGTEIADPKALGAAEERKRAKQIRVLCKMSGCPEKADEFIDAEFSVAETRESLSKLMEKQNKIIPADEADDSPEPDADKTREDGYRKEYRDQQKIHQTFGISEEEYIEQRLIEDGHKDEPAIMPGITPKAA